MAHKWLNWLILPGFLLSSQTHLLTRTAHQSTRYRRNKRGESGLPRAETHHQGQA